MNTYEDFEFFIELIGIIELTNKFSEKNNLFFLIWYRNKEEFQEEDIERKKE